MLREWMVAEEDWVERWSQRGDAEKYICWGEQGAALVDFADIARICIFNCSDGPSALGMIQGIQRTSLELEVCYLADISPHAVDRCCEFIKQRQEELPLVPVVTATEQLVPELADLTDEFVQAFISFEPVGDLEGAFVEMLGSLPHGGSLTVCARGYFDIGLKEFRQVSKMLGVQLNFRVCRVEKELPLVVATIGGKLTRGV